MISIRKSVLSDALSMGNIYCKGWQKGYAGIVPQAFLDCLTPERCAPEGIDFDSAFVAELNGELAGLLTFHPGEAEDEWVIQSFYVLPEHWRSGVGSALFAAAKDEFRRLGGKEFFLCTLRKNRRARAFYEKMGMRLTDDEFFFEVAGEKLPEVCYRMEI